MTLINEVLRADWSPAKLRFELEERGLTYRSLSLQAGYSQDSLKAVVRTPCETYERVIANALGVNPEDIWPSRYAFRNRRNRGA